MNYEELVIREVSWEAEPGHQLTLPRHWRSQNLSGGNGQGVF